MHEEQRSVLPTYAIGQLLRLHMCGMHVLEVYGKHAAIQARCLAINVHTKSARADDGCDISCKLCMGTIRYHVLI